MSTVSDINAEGEIAGEYADAAYVFHAFVRDPGGLITTFDAPGAGVGPYQGTFVSSADGLNAEGAVSGFYLDSSNVFHALIRARDGTITTFDVAGAGTGPYRSEERRV